MMNDTPFLKSLRPVDVRTRPAKVAQSYMSVKGFREIRPLGFTSSENTWYFYYHISDGIIELEVTHDRQQDTFSKIVTAFITDEAEIRKRIGS